MHDFGGSESDMLSGKLFEFFSPIRSHMLTKNKNVKKKIHILENETKQNGLKIWWIGTCHQNLVSIHLMVSEKVMSTGGWIDGRCTDGRRPHHDSSSAVQ